MVYEHLTAYRHADESVEGFKGVGSTKASAKADAVEQMKRKADVVAEWKQDDSVFDQSRVVKVISSLTTKQVADVREDWNSGARY